MCNFEKYLLGTIISLIIILLGLVHMTDKHIESMTTLGKQIIHWIK